MSGTCDFLLSATSTFARRLDEHGVDARLVAFDGLPHALWGYLDTAETMEANTLMARFPKAAVARRSGK